MAKDKGLKGGMFGGTAAAAVARVARRAKGAAPVEAERAEKWAVTTFRLQPRHLDALQAEALKRASEARGRGEKHTKADASAVLRELLDSWLAKGRG